MPALEMSCALRSRTIAARAARQPSTKDAAEDEPRNGHGASGRGTIDAERGAAAEFGARD
jgi:hypothetical protein